MQRQEFHDAVAAARRGDRDTARKLMRRVLLDDPNCVPAWVWMSGFVDDPGQQQECLERALKIDPNNQAAREGLNVLRLRMFLSTMPEVEQTRQVIEPQRIGEYLVDHGYITRTQLEAAVIEQHNRRSRGAEHVMVGDILVQLGLLTPRTLASALVTHQQEQSQIPSTKSEPRKIGAYLLDQNMLTPEQLAVILAEQTRMRYAGEHILLGELLISNGFITPRQLESTLAMQSKDFFGSFDADS
jgi:hypothetical protein